MTEFEFEIPGPPVPKERPRVVRQPGRRPRTITPAKTVDYEHRVALAALAARPDDWPRTGAFYSVHAVFYRDTRRGDVDNFLKALLDGAAGVLWTNDLHVVDVHGRVRPGTPSTKVLVRLVDE